MAKPAHQSCNLQSVLIETAASVAREVWRATSLKRTAQVCTQIPSKTQPNHFAVKQQDWGAQALSLSHLRPCLVFGKRYDKIEIHTYVFTVVASVALPPQVKLQRISQRKSGCHHCQIACRQIYNIFTKLATLSCACFNRVFQNCIPNLLFGFFKPCATFA